MSDVHAIATIAVTMPSCASMIHPRRLPQKRLNPGTSYRSSSGAQTNFSVGSNCTHAKKPSTVSATPCACKRSTSTVENM